MSLTRTRWPTGSSPRKQVLADGLADDARPPCPPAPRRRSRCGPSVSAQLPSGPKRLPVGAARSWSASWRRCETASAGAPGPAGATARDAGDLALDRRRRRPCRNRALRPRRRRGQRSPGRAGSARMLAPRLGNLLGDRRACAPLPSVDHRDHRGDADDDAEHGEERSACSGAGSRVARGVMVCDEHQAAFPASTRQSTRPSRKWTMRAGIGGHVGLVGHHQHGDAAVAVEAGRAGP